MQDINFLNNVNINGDEIVRGDERVEGKLQVTENIELSGSILSGGIEISTLWGAGGPVDAPVTSVNGLTGDVALNAANVSALSLTGGSLLGNLNVFGSVNVVSAGNFENLNVAGIGNFLNHINAYSNATVAGVLSADTVASTQLSASSGYFDNLVASNVYGFVDATKLPLSGGTVTGEMHFNDNVTIFGDLSCTGVQTFANTVFITTSALSVVHFGTDTAVYVGSDGPGDIASFYDLDQNIEVLHVGGANSTYPNVGIKTSQPNKDFTVAGEISAKGTIWNSVGNSLQWSSVYSTTTANSATWGSSSLQTDVQVFTAAGTWTKPADARSVHMVIIGGGGSGQGGGMWDGATAVVAAVGGGGGGLIELDFRASDLPASLDVNIGQGGLSAAGRTTAGIATNGNAGSPTILSAAGVIYAQAGGGGGGNATGLNAGVYNGNNGGTATMLTGGSTQRGGPGGGVGGGLNAGGTTTVGRDGGAGMAGAIAGGSAGVGNNFTNGGDGGAGSRIANLVGASVSSAGGGGGASSWASGVGGAGGDGGGWGSGGGGGGAGKAGGGASGSGAPGLCVITTYF